MKHKISYSVIRDQNLADEMGQSFQNISYFEMGQIDYGGAIISAFVQFNSADTLRQEWRDINNFITAKYISRIKDDYSKWNFYIFYLSVNKVAKDLKYEVENNKFSSRKTIVECDTAEIEPDLIDRIISEHITNDTIEFEVVTEEIDEFVRNEFITRVMVESSINRVKTIKEENLLQVLDNIEKAFKNED